MITKIQEHKFGGFNYTKNIITQGGRGVDWLKQKVQKIGSTINIQHLHNNANIHVRMFLKKFKNSKLEPICTLNWNII